MCNREVHWGSVRVSIVRISITISSRIIITISVGVSDVVCEWGGGGGGWGDMGSCWSGAR